MNHISSKNTSGDSSKVSGNRKWLSVSAVAVIMMLIGLVLWKGPLRAWLSGPTPPAERTADSPTPPTESPTDSPTDSPTESPVALPRVPRESAPPAFLETLDRYERSVRESPGDDETWGRLGMFLLAHSYHSAALDCFAEATRLDPTAFAWPYCRAVILEETDFEGAAAAYQVALETDPAYAPAHLRRGQVLLRLGLTDEALQHLTQAEQLTNGHPLPRIALARLRIAAGDLEPGRNLLETIVQQANWYKDAHAELARLHFMLGDSDKAFEANRMAARLPPSPNELPDPILRQVEQLEIVAKRLAAQADSEALKGQWSDAEQEFRKLIAQRPDLARPRLKLGEVLLGQGRIAEAIAQLEQVVKQFPREADAFYLLGLAYESAKAPHQAIASYRKCLEVNPASAEAHYALGLVLEKEEAFRDAADHYEQAVAAAPQFAPAHLALGLALDRLGRTAEGIRHVRNAVRLAPGDPYPQNFLNQLLEKVPDPARPPTPPATTP